MILTTPERVIVNPMNDWRNVKTLFRPLRGWVRRGAKRTGSAPGIETDDISVQGIRVCRQYPPDDLVRFQVAALTIRTDQKPLPPTVTCCMVEVICIATGHRDRPTTFPHMLL